MDEEEILRAKKKALSLLQHGDRTEWELADRLKQKGFCDEAAAAAVEYVKSFHYVDDEKYAERFVEIYRESRSAQRIKADLAKRHVPKEYISSALEGLDDGRALQKEYEKACRGREELSHEEKQKIAARLCRKGFRASDVRRLMDI